MRRTFSQLQSPCGLIPTSLTLIQYLVSWPPSSASQEPLGFPSTQLWALCSALTYSLVPSTELLILGPSCLAMSMWLLFCFP